MVQGTKSSLSRRAVCKVETGLRKSLASRILDEYHSVMSEQYPLIASMIHTEDATF